MDCEDSVSRLLIVLLASAGVAHAECYVRSATNVVPTARIERITDVTRNVLPEENNQLKCRVTFRALIKDKWYTVEGENTGKNTDSLDKICASAYNAGSTRVLSSVSGTAITAQQDMVCTDQPMPKFRPRVAIGDAVRDSELQPHQIYRNTFTYQGSVCRWFMESTPSAGQVEMSQGIMCRTPQNSVWRVVDKW